MKIIRKFLRNTKRKLILSVNSKLIVVMLSIFSLILTLFFVRYIKSYNNENEDSITAYYYQALKDGRSAVSIVINVDDTPIDLIYPGVKVDILEKQAQEVNFIVKNVYVVSATIYQDGEKIKVDLALNEQESKRVMLTNTSNLKLLVKGEDSKIGNTLEIQEL